MNLGTEPSVLSLKTKNYKFKYLEGLKKEEDLLLLDNNNIELFFNFIISNKEGIKICFIFI